MERKRIAIVVQRYGPEVLGGSESLARSLAHLLSDVYDIDVLTTCAKDYVTWKNEFPAGESMDGPVKVLRFAVDRPRSTWFNLYNALMLKVPHTRWMEELWMKMQGPCSTGLFNYIADYRDQYHSFIFLTYLYATTYFGIREATSKALIIPTAHDEPYLKFGIFSNMFQNVRLAICLTDEEKALVEGTFSLKSGQCEVIGVPVGDCLGDPGISVKKYGLDGNFIAYFGRIDTMKGVDTLVDYFNRYTAERASAMPLVLCGSGPLQVPEFKYLVCPGYVSEVEKYSIMRAALAVVHPSRYESYSISVVEALACGTPVIANGQCAVLKGHCEKSGGGLAYRSYEEFRDAIDLLVDDRALRNRMALAGHAYAYRQYSKDTIRKRYISLLDGLTNKK